MAIKMRGSSFALLAIPWCVCRAKAVEGNVELLCCVTAACLWDMRSYCIGEELSLKLL